MKELRAKLIEVISDCIYRKNIEIVCQMLAEEDLADAILEKFDILQKGE